MSLLAGKRLLITGVVTEGSIAHATAARALELGADVVLTAFPRDRHLTDDALGSLPYDWMGVCKAALESANRYLARDLGPLGIRANLVAAGPLHTRAASGIPAFERLTEAWDRGAPLEWNPHDPTPVADATCFLLSDLARGISGEIVHVDGGYHAMAAPLR